MVPSLQDPGSFPSKHHVPKSCHLLDNGLTRRIGQNCSHPPIPAASACMLHRADGPCPIPLGRSCFGFKQAQDAFSPSGSPDRRDSTQPIHRAILICLVSYQQEIMFSCKDVILPRATRHGAKVPLLLPSSSLQTDSLSSGTESRPR